MDFLKNINNSQPGQAGQQQQASANPEQQGSGGGLMGKFNNALGGGQSGEQKEDGLDKAVDFVQERVFKQGPQTNESAVEQAKDEQISDGIRAQYKKFAGKDFPVQDKS